jgi:hypothetical protein
MESGIMFVACTLERTRLRIRNLFSYVDADEKVILKGDFNECVSDGRFRGSYGSIGGVKESKVS